MSLPSARQVLRVLGFLLLLAIVIPFVVYAVPATVGAEGGYVVLSGSMEPAISVGDVVIVDEVDPATIQEGDVITYLRSGEDTPTTHRVIGIEDEGGELAFQTKGDNSESPDASPVPASQVNGKVIFTIPYIGHVVEFVNTPYGFAALVGVPFALLVVSELYSFFRGSRGTKADPDSGDGGSSGEEPGAGEGDGEPAPAAAEAAATPPEEANEDDDTIAITRKDLRLSLVVLVGTAIYSGWVVTLIQEPWSFAVAFASGIGVLLVGGMFYFAGPQEGAEVEDGSAGAGSTGEGGAPAPPSDGSAPRAVANGGSVDPRERIVSGALPAENGATAEVEVDGIEELAEMAAETGEWIVDDEDAPGYYLPGSEVTYSWYPDADGEGVDTGADSDSQAEDGTGAEDDVETEDGAPTVDQNESVKPDDAFEFSTDSTEVETASAEMQTDPETEPGANSEPTPDPGWEPELDSESNRPDAVSAGGTDPIEEILENDDN
ncbi:MAG: signal peptidase I [Haloferacaceae archaeon]